MICANVQIPLQGDDAGQICEEPAHTSLSRKTNRQNPCSKTLFGEYMCVSVDIDMCVYIYVASACARQREAPQRRRLSRARLATLPLFEGEVCGKWGGFRLSFLSPSLCSVPLCVILLGQSFLDYFRQIVCI